MSKDSTAFDFLNTLKIVDFGKSGMEEGLIFLFK